jgi:high-affinity K+ transport system ATPase subunit B
MLTQTIKDHMEPETQSPQQFRKTEGLTGRMYRRALLDSFGKLNPRLMMKNPVMFVVEVGSLLTTALWIQALAGTGEAPAWYIGSVTLYGPLCQLFRGSRGGAGQGAGGSIAPRPERYHG